MTPCAEDLAAIVKRHWGYGEFLPLQREAMASVLAGRDSLVVLPTGGGKSLCYQAPAMAMDGMAVVVSPLISLMKDQVDALVECGVPAACLHGNLSSPERLRVMSDLREGRLKLLYVAPERLMAGGLIEFLRDAGVSFFAVDEVHCVSMWGHDFRPEYRQLAALKKEFPGAAVHGYTATATERVRLDVAAQLALESPEVLVGSFDRPNLIYRAEARRGGAGRVAQVREAIDRHSGESGIIYCISRRNVEELCEALVAAGYKARPYHAGLDGAVRRANQDAFAREETDIIVATVAFGMGIDKSNVRYVIHAGMPKSLEHYQQESGRAGRDGLEAECVLLHSAQDFWTWRRILTNGDGGASEEVVASVLEKLDQAAAYANGVVCRRRTLLEYFGEAFEKENCGGCDVCLGRLDVMDDALVVAQKILSCVVRLQQVYGGDYTADVLVGSKRERVIENGHDGLSTYGLLADHKKRAVRDWIEQLVSQDLLRKEGEFHVLKVTEKGRRALRGEETARLLRPAARAEARKAKAAVEGWKDVDRDLFEALRALRAGLAREKSVPAFVVFGDAALRDMARKTPASAEEFLEVHGVGKKKQSEYGPAFLKAIADHQGAQRTPSC